MDYELKYKQALDKANVIHKCGNNQMKQIMEQVFPELKESENEMIRKEILDYIDKSTGCERWIAWLEKQCDKDNYPNLPKFTFDDVLALQCCMETVKKVQEDKTLYEKLQSLHNRVHDAYHLEKQGEQKSTLRIDNSKAKVVFPFKAKVKSTGIVVTIHDGQLSIDGKEWTKYQSDNEDGYKVYEPEVLEYVCNVEPNPAWFEKQGEQKQNPYSGTSFEYNGHTFGMCARDNGVEILMDGELKAFVSSEKSFVYPIHPQPDLAPKNTMEAIKEEKVDNANKLEPKFKVRDWVVDSQGLTHQIERVVENVTTHTFGYDIVGGGYFNDDNEGVHLWTIQDAKDGDVLVCEDYGYTSYLLLKSFSDKTIELHCWYNRQTNNLHNGTEVITREDARIHPATKEQRDLLFQKMKESGYEWDAENKKLKKIYNALEECEIENIEHGKYYYCIKDYFAGGKKQASKGDVVQALRGLPIMGLGVKANEYFIPVNSIKVEKPVWSEDDEHKIKDIVYFLDTAKKHYASTVELDACIAWLKSLKDRVQTQWKPSEEQMQALEYHLHSTNYESWQWQETKKLYDDIKKLKEE